MPAYFYDINAQIFKEGRPENDLETVKVLGIWLQEHIKGGPGLSEPSDKALEIMLAGRGGVCSDVAQVFNNFCVINAIKVREWGTTSIPFSRENGGHSFNEVYSKELNKWVLLDVYWNLLFYSEDDVPLSVLEVYQLKRNEKKVQHVSFSSEKILDKVGVNKNYLNPDIGPFLICNYKNKTYDAFLRARPLIPVFVIHFMLYMLGKSYYYKFPLDDYKKMFSLPVWAFDSNND
jgi:hypothetical protein